MRAVTHDHRAELRAGVGYLIQVHPGIERISFAELRAQLADALHESFLDQTS
jgi:RNase P protein component